jgi:uncharacterized protein YdhG (YjbR/CyaY superfamily)
MPKFPSIDAYIAAAPKATRSALKEMRRIIRTAAPDATEAISYLMPTFRLNGDLVHFAAYKDHLGFYGFGALPTAWEGLKSGRGSVRFPYDAPLPEKEIIAVVRKKAASMRKKNAKPKPAAGKRKPAAKQGKGTVAKPKRIHAKST